ncbi:hypothetical protein T439DRAFT_383402 [Meredithblackwellia eburnea MCA 4105]
MSQNRLYWKPSALLSVDQWVWDCEFGDDVECDENGRTVRKRAMMKSLFQAAAEARRAGDAAVDEDKYTDPTENSVSKHIDYLHSMWDCYKKTTGKQVDRPTTSNPFGVPGDWHFRAEKRRLNRIERDANTERRGFRLVSPSNKVERERAKARGRSGNTADTGKEQVLQMPQSQWKQAEILEKQEKDAQELKELMENWKRVYKKEDAEMDSSESTPTLSPPDIQRRHLHWQRIGHGLHRDKYFPLARSLFLHQQRA